MYAHKPDKVLQWNLLAAAFGINFAIMHMFKAEYITATVYQVIIAFVVVQMRFGITQPFFIRAHVDQLVIAIEFNNRRPVDHAYPLCPIFCALRPLRTAKSIRRLSMSVYMPVKYKIAGIKTRFPGNINKAGNKFLIYKRYS